MVWFMQPGTMARHMKSRSAKRSVHAPEVVFGPNGDMRFALMTLPHVLEHLEGKFNDNDFGSVNKKVEQVEADALAHVLDRVAENHGVETCDPGHS
jgi:hypothetical protein